MVQVMRPARDIHLGSLIKTGGGYRGIFDIELASGNYICGLKLDEADLWHLAQVDACVTIRVTRGAQDLVQPHTAAANELVYSAHLNMAYIAGPGNWFRIAGRTDIKVEVSIDNVGDDIANNIGVVLMEHGWK